MTIFRRTLILIITQVVIGSVCFAATGSKVYCAEVLNGYSFTVHTEEGVRIIRIAEIMPPRTLTEATSSNYEAKGFLQELIGNKELTLVFWANDKAGRSVCEVLLPDGMSVAAIMIAEGYARQDPHYSFDQILTHLEEEAKFNTAGVWKKFTLSRF